ncbi:MAG: DUF7700 domain-containing protein, partial [Myxococcota bacterium]
NETGALSRTTLRDSRDVRLRTAGRVIGEMQVRLFDGEGRDVTQMGRGQPGCRGPLASVGYWDDAAANARLLNDAIAAAAAVIAARDAQSAPQPVGDMGALGLDDRGVSLHVFSAGDGTAAQEFLRFDCFDEDPHYHYISWRAMSNEMLHMDPIADGDPLAWALERIRTRLPQMLARAGAPAVAARVDPAEIERALPRIAEAAYRARYHSDAGAVLRSALGSAA